MTVLAIDLDNNKKRDRQVHNVKKVEILPDGMLRLTFEQAPTFYLCPKRREIVIVN